MKKNKKPGEIISRSIPGEVLGPLPLPPELATLSDHWRELTYDQRIAYVKGRPLQERLLLLKSVGGVCKNAIQVVCEFRPIIEVCRDEFRQPGQRVPVEGKPTWTKFIPETFGFSPRRMQQLLADGNPDGGRREKSPRQAHEAKRGPKTGPEEDYHRLLKVEALAVDLARSVVEQGDAERYPEADEILKITGSEANAQPSRSCTLASSRIAEPGDTEEEGQITGIKIGPQPDCYICGTGLHTCALHAPQLEALMFQRGIEDHDASDILLQQFAKQGHRFLKTA